MDGAKNSRLAYADMMKGIAILGMVIFHLLAPCSVRTVVSHIGDSLLAVFFFYAGYFYTPGKRSIKESLSARFKGLMVPFFGYSLAFWFIGSVYLILAKLETVKEALCCLRNFYAGCIWNRVIQDWFQWDYYSLGKRYMFLADFWFFLALMISFCVFIPLAESVLRKKPLAFVITILLFAVSGALRAAEVSLPYNLQLIPFWTGLLMLGALSRQINLMELPFMTGVKGWMLAVTAFVAGTALSMIRTPQYNIYRGTFVEGEEVKSMILYIVTLSLFIWGLSNIFRLVEQSGFRVKEIARLGTLSLYIFLYHVFFAWGMGIIFNFPIRYEEVESPAVIIRSIVVMITSLALSICAGLITEGIKASAKKSAV